MTTQSSSEQQAQRTAFDTASATGRSTLITSVRAFGDALFNSAEYAARNRSNHDYVYDLYWAYLQYAPDSVGWSYWEGQVASQGRTVVRNAFADTPTFQEIAGGLYREVLWLTPDHPGTPRIIAERTGSLVGIKRHDYLPFGEELFAGTGGRTTAQGYSVGDGIRQKFTQKERDSETGLDYFLARYYSSTQGRFTSPDEFQGGPHELELIGSGQNEKQALPYANPVYPQSLNKYQYAYSNPLRYVDPDGHDVWEDLKNGAVGAAKTVANIFIEGSPLIAFPNGVSTILTGKPIIKQFEATNRAQQAGMITATVATIFIPGAGEELAVERGLSVAEAGVIRSAKNILAKVMNPEHLQAAAREAAGEIVALKPNGQAFDHISEVKEGLRGLQNAERSIGRSLKDSRLSGEARETLQRNLGRIRTSVQRTQKYMRDHGIN